MEQRTQGIGILDRQIARDLRFDHPYADYGNIPKTLFTFTGGDVFSRVIYAARIDLSVALLASLLALIVGLPLGALAALGWTMIGHVKELPSRRSARSL